MLHRRVALANAPRSEAEMEERNDLCSAVIHAQETAIVQCLLEICDAKSDENALILRRIRRTVAALVHHMFIMDTLLTKLVHFQMYPIRLIAVMVKEVPSMHICLDFIPELLAQADIRRRVFGVALLAELAGQYRIPLVYAQGQLIVDVLHSLLTETAIDQAMELCNAVLPSLGRLMLHMPALGGALSELLARVAALAKARLALNIGPIHRKTVEKQVLDDVAGLLSTPR